MGLKDFFSGGSNAKEENSALNHVDNGDLVKDLLSGMEGVIISVTKWQHGCDRVQIQQRGLTEGGELHKAEVFDVQRVALVEKSVVPQGPLDLILTAMPLGSKARDTVTGFAGIIAAQIIGLSGQVDLLLEPDALDKDGQPKKAQAFEGSRCALVVKQEVLVDPAAPKKTGGPMRGEEISVRR